MVRVIKIEWNDVAPEGLNEKDKTEELKSLLSLMIERLFVDSVFKELKPKEIRQVLIEKLSQHNKK